MADPGSVESGISKVKFDDKHKDVLESAAHYLYSENSIITEELERLGHKPPPALAANWRAVPDLQKLWYACQAAKEAQPEGGDQRFLALLAADLSHRYSIEDHPLLKEFVDRGKNDAAILAFLKWRYSTRPGTDPPPPPVAFMTTNPDKPPPSLPVAWKTVLLEVEKLTNAGILNLSEHTILTSIFGLSSEQAETQLLKSSTFHDAMQMALFEQPSSEGRVRILTRLATSIYYQYPLLDTHPVLKDWIKPNPAERTVVRPAKSEHEAGRMPILQREQAPERPRTVERKEKDISAESRHDKSMKGTYKDGQNRDFNQMGTKVKDFGGGVLGNKLLTDTLPKPLAVRYKLDGKLGSFVIRCEGDRTLTLSNVLIEDLWVANQLVFVKDWQPGQGIGLVGLLRTGYHWEFGERRFNLMRRNEVTLHPALIDTEAGHAAINVDTNPGREFEPWLQNMKQVPRVVRHELLMWIQSHQKALVGSNYVFTDVPIRISEFNGNLITVAEFNDNTNLPRTLRENAFLELRLQTDADAQEPDKRYDQKFAHEFYRHLPLFIEASYDLRRINRLAAVVAVLRWAKGSGVGKVDDLLDKPHAGERTPDAIAEKINDVPDGDEQERFLNMAAKILNELTDGSKENVPHYVSIPSTEAREQLNVDLQKVQSRIAAMTKDTAVQTIVKDFDDKRTRFDELAKEHAKKTHELVKNYKAKLKTNSSKDKPDWNAKLLASILDSGRVIDATRIAETLKNLGDKEAPSLAKYWLFLHYFNSRLEADVSAWETLSKQD